MDRRRVNRPQPLETLLAMPLKRRILAVAEDVDSRTDTFRLVEAFELAEALGVPQPEMPDGSWSFTSYAERQTVEQYIDSGRDPLTVLESLRDLVGERRFRTLEAAFSRLPPTGKSCCDFLTSKERKSAEAAVAEERLEANRSNGMCCVASYRVKRGRIELWFEADIEDDESCIELRTPYDERDGKFRDLANCILDSW
jgi:hypothetical protein